MDNNTIEKHTVRRVGGAKQPPETQSAETQAEQELQARKPPSEKAKQAADLAIQHQLQREREAHGTAGGSGGGGGAHHSKNDSTKSSTKKKRRRPWVIVLVCVAALLVIGGGVLLKFYHDISNPAGLFDDPTPAPATPAPSAPQETYILATPAPTPDPETMLLSEADLEFMKNRVNILVLGIDESTEREHWGSFRTDTMILTTIDFDTNDVTMISVPRDSFVKIADGEGRLLKDGEGEGETYQYAKINSAFSTGGGSKKNGYAYAMGTVSYTLGGIPIQYYVGFNMNVVKEIVDAMGGLEYEIDVPVSMNGREYEPGLQYMDGQAVLDYARQRKGSSDIARVERQQNILKAIFQEMKKTGQIANIPDIYMAVQNNIETNLSFKQISSLALLALRMDIDQLQSHTLDGSFLNMKSVSYWGLYTNKIKSMIEEVFGISVSIDSDLNVTNIRAQIEANRQLIAVELNAAKSAIDTADAILAGYGDWLTDDAKSRLKAAKEQCEDAYDAEDKALLDYYTPPLQQVNNELLMSLQQAGLLGGNAGTDAVGGGAGDAGEAVPEGGQPAG